MQIYFELLIIPIVSRRELTLRQKLSFIVSFLKHLKAEESEISNDLFGKYTLTDGKAVNCDPDNCVDLDQIITQQYIWKGYIVDRTNLEKLIERIGSYCNEYWRISCRFDKEKTLDYKRLLECWGFDMSWTKLYPRSIAFGNIINGNQFVIHFELENTLLRNNIYVNQDELIKKLILMLPDPTNEFYQYKLEYEYDSIREIIISQVTDTFGNIYFHLSHPPKIFINKTKGKENKAQWSRWFDCGIISQDVIGKTKFLRLKKRVESRTPYYSPFEIIDIDMTNRRKNTTDISTMSFASIDEILVNSEHHSVYSDFPFDITYALDCIRSQNYTFQDELNHNGEKNFASLVKMLIDEGKHDQIVEALYRLADEYKNDQVNNSYHQFRLIFEQVDKDFKTAGTPNKGDRLKYVRDAILTPTRIILHPPSPYRISYFLNNADPDYVLQISIRDEDQTSMLRNGKRDKLENDYERMFWEKVVKDRLVKDGGLNIVDRLYQFYGSSVSQFKEGGMILYAKDSLQRTADSLRSSFGIVNEKTLPKYIARIGLSLSKLIGYIDLPSTTNFFISPDVYGGSHPSSKQPYNFTDGCGFISSSLSSYLSDKLMEQRLIKVQDKSETSPLSAFQVRLMGAKGMLVVDRNLTGNSIILRESMIKLIGKKGDMGIIKVNEPRMAYLNRPFISILNQIGLDNQLFIDLLSDTLDDLYRCFCDNSIAVSTLKKYSAISRFIDIKSLARAGYKLYDDPFFSQILSSVYNSALELIKSKARIPLPMDKARTMFGVTDPTVGYSKFPLEFDENGNVLIPEMDCATNCLGSGKLKSGEVFVWPSDSPKPLEGEIIVTKFPVSDPGDIRKLNAVDRSQLHHIRDCIVFPVDGSRPHPDEMSGSDLDGDEYCVIWLEDFKGITIHPPMDYPSSSSSSTCDEITDEKQIDFFIEYNQSSSVGLIANAHLAWADKDGINSEKCKQLSLKNAVALDIAKQGINEKYCFQDEDKYKFAPSFMEKDEILPTYYSDRALDDIHTFTSLVQVTPQSFERNFERNKKLIHSDWTKFIDSAEKAHAEYEIIRNNLLRYFNFSSEIELFIQVNSKSFDDQKFSDNCDSAVLVVRELLVKRVNRYFAIKEEPMSDKLARASAFYMITYEKAESQGFCGLPFIGDCAKYLVKLLENNDIKDNIKVSSPDEQSIITLDAKVEQIADKTINKLSEWIRLFPYRRHKGLRVKKQLLLDSINSFNLGRLRESLKNLNKFADKLLEDNNLDDWLFSLSSGSNKLLVKVFIALLKHESTTEKQPIVLKRLLLEYSDQVRAESLIETLTTIVSPAKVTKEGRIKNCITITIYGAPATILLASIVTRVYNRQAMINFTVR